MGERLHKNSSFGDIGRVFGIYHRRELVRHVRIVYQGVGLLIILERSEPEHDGRQTIETVNHN